MLILGSIEELQAVDTQIESVIQMLDKQEIGGTTFTQMVENIIIDSGLDMELTFAEPDMEMEMYLDDDKESEYRL